MVLNVNGAIQIQYKAIGLGSDHIDFQGEGGGGLGLSDWPEYYFLSLSGPEYFCPIYYEPAFYFSNHSGPEYCILYNTNLEATL